MNTVTAVYKLLFRYMEKDVLTVREAVWLTDNTYKYEELVRMMEEILSALKGDIKVSVLFHIYIYCGTELLCNNNKKQCFCLPIATDNHGLFDDLILIEDPRQSNKVLCKVDKIEVICVCLDESV